MNDLLLSFAGGHAPAAELKSEKEPRKIKSGRAGAHVYIRPTDFLLKSAFKPHKIYIF